MASMRRSPVFRYLLAMALSSILLTTLLPGVAFGAPWVFITKPAQGAVVTGAIWIDVAYRSDSNLPITRLEIYIDDQLRREVDLAVPLLDGRQSFNWDFTYSSNTVHKIGARAIDSSGAAAAASVTVQVQNAAATGPDRIPPMVRIYYPAQGAKLRGTVEVKAEATDDVGVEQVWFYVDGNLHKMMMNTPPYTDSWDTSRTDDGTHVLEAVAFDAAENEARSAQVTVVVENHSMTLMSNGGSPLNTLGTEAVPAPAPAPAPLPTVPQPAPSVVTPPVPTPVAPPVVTPEPKVFNVKPRATAPGPLPTAPETGLPDFSSGPVATTGSRPSTVSTISPSLTNKPVTGNLSRPVSGDSRPGPAPLASGAHKATAPTLERLPSPKATGQQVAAVPAPQPLPVAANRASAPQTVPFGAAVGGRTADLSPLAINIPEPAGSRSGSLLPKAHGPVGTLTQAAPARVSAPAPVVGTASPAKLATTGRAGLAPLSAPKPGDRERIVPVGLPRPMAAPAPNPSQPVVSVTPTQKLAPSATSTKPALTSTPKPEQVAAVGKPATLPTLFSQAALAEYKSFPVPASRMLARLPETDSGRLAADGKTTSPGDVTVAVPLHVAQVKDIRIVFDGEVLSLRAAPEARQGIALAPLREIFEQTDGVLYWFPVERSVRAVNKNVDMSMKIGSPKVSVNGEERTLVVAPYIKRGRTMVPLQFIADVLDVNITFNSTTGQILISSNQL